ncbi:hypothetical protein [Sphingomonas sp. 3-13AW]|uniref:hypothetical protein n=1 Tax=Sphingomonas sp. 3-13AW TaxID=3050450 RepID=UPI003BB77CD3
MTLGTTSSFSLGGVFVGFLLGALVSLPWMVVLASVIWLYGSWVDRHPLLFATIGPLIVVGSCTMFTDGVFIHWVGISAGVSSLFYLALVHLNRLLPASRGGSPAN